jgi:hypothetical protein
MLRGRLARLVCPTGSRQGDQRGCGIRISVAWSGGLSSVRCLGHVVSSFGSSASIYRAGSPVCSDRLDLGTQRFPVDLGVSKISDADVVPQLFLYDLFAGLDDSILGNESQKSGKLFVGPSLL